MNRPEIERLIEQYRTDPSIIFQMKSIAVEVPCGTAMCIAGQTCFNAGWRLEPLDTPGAIFAWAFKGDEQKAAFFAAADILDLTEDEADSLFYKENWPGRFRLLPDTPALAADRLQHFIDTNGAE